MTQKQFVGFGLAFGLALVLSFGNGYSLGEKSRAAHKLGRKVGIARQAIEIARKWKQRAEDYERAENGLMPRRKRIDL